MRNYESSIFQRNTKVPIEIQLYLSKGSKRGSKKGSKKSTTKPQKFVLVSLCVYRSKILLPGDGVDGVYVFSEKEEGKTQAGEQKLKDLFVLDADLKKILFHTAFYNLEKTVEDSTLF